MGKASTIGVDISKSVFQIHGVDANGTVVIRMEACATAHQWARTQHGHARSSPSSSPSRDRINAAARGL
jgi:transposase